jgi:hypothetical protein
MSGPCVQFNSREERSNSRKARSLSYSAQFSQHSKLNSKIVQTRKKLKRAKWARLENVHSERPTSIGGI